MAYGKIFCCTVCSFKIVAWDEGNPYYRLPSGRKRYAYHPSAERDLCIGNDALTLCLDCGAQFMIDSEKPRTNCRKCKSERIADAFELDGLNCPACKEGTFGSALEMIS